jgi:hypothetical protein
MVLPAAKGSKRGKWEKRIFLERSWIGASIIKPAELCF